MFCLSNFSSTLCTCSSLSISFFCDYSACLVKQRLYFLHKTVIQKVRITKFSFVESWTSYGILQRGVRPEWRSLNFINLCLILKLIHPLTHPLSSFPKSYRFYKSVYFFSASIFGDTNEFVPFMCIFFFLDQNSCFHIILCKLDLLS